MSLLKCIWKEELLYSEVMLIQYTNTHTENSYYDKGELKWINHWLEVHLHD